ncbi:MAG: TolC family protein [Bacteroidales bacterium]
MKRVRFVFLMAIVLMASSYLLEAQSTSDTLKLDLKQSLELLIEQNPAVNAANQANKQMEYELKATHGLYMPKVGVSANFGIVSEAVTIDHSPIGKALEGLYSLSAGQVQMLGALNPAITSTVEYQTLLQGAQEGLAKVQAANWKTELLGDNVGMVSANVSWPIFTGGKIMAANNAAKAKVAESEEKARMITNGEVTSLVQRYYGLQLTIEVSKVRESVVNGMLEHLDNAKKLEKNGMISEAERLHAEVAYAEANRELKKALGDVELMQTALKNVLNVDKPIYPTGNLFIAANLQSVDDYVNRAKELNPIFGQLEQKRIQASQAILKERSAYLPDVAVIGSYDIYRHQISDMVVPDWFVGVGLKLNIFDGLAKNNKVQAAKIQRSQVDTYREKASLDITTGVTKVYQQMLQAKEQYESSAVSIKFAEEYLRVRQKAFGEGFATSTEVVDANMNLSRVKVEQLKAMYDFDIALATLLELVGDSQSFTQYTTSVK